ncbi:MAG: hypothetical protein KGM47_16905 [Acidobacteriota bacterium]|nr:hypothetical protein [Acidobacteriota bacterium]
MRGISGRYCYIDLFWPGVALVDHKSFRQDLGKAVDLCYRPQPFENDLRRVEHLFTLYEKLTALLLPACKTRRPRAGSN